MPYPSVARARTRRWTRQFARVEESKCIYWTIWGRASKLRGDNFARRVAQLSASAKYLRDANGYNPVVATFDSHVSHA